MTLMIVEFLPWFAFAGAAFLLGWVGVDILMSKLRTAGKAPAPQPKAESGRGLVGTPEPFAEDEEPEEPAEEVIAESQAAEEEPAESVEPEPSEEPKEAAEAAEEPASTDSPDEDESVEIPTSHAQNVAETPEVSDNEDASDADAVTQESAETEETSEDTTSEEDEEVLADVVMVRRDPSVRVFDAVVAPSSRKVRSTEG